MIAVRRIREWWRSNSRAKRARAKDGIEFGNCLNGKFERAEIGAQALGEFEEDARNFRRFVLGKLDQAVIELDGFKRLDENRLPGRAGGVDDALQSRGGRRRARE